MKGLRHFRNIYFALAALLWLPLSAHCQLETVPGLEFIRCQVEAQSPDDAKNNCNDCSCCSVEKSSFQSEHTRLTIALPDLLPLSFVSLVPAASTLPDEVSLGIL